jgi:DME family drug/metabolite transporter
VFRVSWLGAVVGLLTAITHSIYVMFSQRMASTHSPWTTLTYTMGFGAVTLLLMLGVSAPQNLMAVGAEPTPWLVVLGLAIGPTLCGYALFTAALRHVPGATAGLISVIEAPAATLLAVALLGERLELPQVLGMALVLGAIFVPTLARRAGDAMRSMSADRERPERAA